MRNSFLYCFFILATTIWLKVSATAPNNDRFANRLVLSGTNIVTTGSNTSATNEVGEPNHAGRSGGKSVWWSWTAPSSGIATIKTDGSSFNTLLAVYTGSSVSNLITVASSDDNGNQITSLVNFSAGAGTTYQIAVDGLNGASGTIGLTLTLRPGVLQEPANNNFTNRISLVGIPVTVMGSNLAATKEPGEPNHGVEVGGASVWWTWLAPVSGKVVVKTEGSNFDTLLGVYTGSSISNLAEVASNDDDGDNITSRVTFTATAGLNYSIAVDGFNGEIGDIVLNIAISDSPPSFTTAAHLQDGSFALTLLGTAGRNYGIDTSTNLVNWTSLAMLTTTNDLTNFTDRQATNFVRRFYRAVLQP